MVKGWHSGCPSEHADTGEWDTRESHQMLANPREGSRIDLNTCALKVLSVNFLGTRAACGVWAAPGGGLYGGAQDALPGYVSPEQAEWICQICHLEKKCIRSIVPTIRLLYVAPALVTCPLSFLFPDILTPRASPFQQLRISKYSHHRSK